MILALALAQFIASYAGRAVPRRRRPEAAGIALGWGDELIDRPDSIEAAGTGPSGSIARSALRAARPE